MKGGDRIGQHFWHRILGAVTGEARWQVRVVIHVIQIGKVAGILLAVINRSGGIALIVDLGDIVFLLGGQGATLTGAGTIIEHPFGINGALAGLGPLGTFAELVGAGGIEGKGADVGILFAVAVGLLGVGVVADGEVGVKDVLNAFAGGHAVIGLGVDAVFGIIDFKG